MKDRPVIGLSTYRQQARWGVWDASADLLPSRYAHAVEAAGGLPVLLPPVLGPAVGAEPGPERAGWQAARQIVARLDALVVTGGSDVDPARYGAEPHPETTGWRPDRDAWELVLLDAADEAGLPILGVCRGMQLMAVWAGGTLEQHVPDQVGHERHSPGPDSYGSVDVSTVAGSTVHELLGMSFQVSCHHHQSVATHPGFVVTARAEDGTVEAMESTDRPFRLGVQWHPEVLDDFALFAGLVREAST